MIFLRIPQAGYLVGAADELSDNGRPAMSRVCPNLNMLQEGEVESEVYIMAGMGKREAGGEKKFQVPPPAQRSVDNLGRKFALIARLLDRRKG
jgi:hypothetical protein